MSDFLFVRDWIRFIAISVRLADCALLWPKERGVRKESKESKKSEKKKGKKEKGKKKRKRRNDRKSHSKMHEMSDVTSTIFHALDIRFQGNIYIRKIKKRQKIRTIVSRSKNLVSFSRSLFLSSYVLLRDSSLLSLHFLTFLVSLSLRLLIIQNKNKYDNNENNNIPLLFFWVLYFT